MTIDSTAIESIRAIAEGATESDLVRYRGIRTWTEHIVSPLAVEDTVVQTMPDVSPTKWHLAHTSWFFETFLLTPHLTGYRSPQPIFESLFNSYYNSVGAQFSRPERGLLSRPTLAEVLEYRRVIDVGIAQLIERGLLDNSACRAIFELGMRHEQQHQELMVTDLKHVLSQNLVEPIYRERADAPNSLVSPLEWIAFPEQVCEIGFDKSGDAEESPFSFDNEGPRHRVLVGDFELATRPVTAGEYLAFIDDGGYRTHSLWLSEGWARVRDLGWQAPLYWREDDGAWTQFTLSGRRPIDRSEPVTHLSYFEADAFARWAGARLPTEFEWEVAAEDVPVEGRFAESNRFHPGPAPAGAPGLTQMYGDVWQWTQSAYGPYPGYAPAEGALGEYNGKFMSGQMVLRGGSIATPAGHVRPTYRNFWHPPTRFQFSGVRLARKR